MHTTIGVNLKDRTSRRRTSRELRQAFKDDKRFFRNHSLRRHRVRLAVPDEYPAALLPGERMYAVVRKIAEGVHMKCYFSLMSESELPGQGEDAWLRQMDEDDCAAAFRTYQPPSSETLVTAITDITWREALAPEGGSAWIGVIGKETGARMRGAGEIWKAHSLLRVAARDHRGSHRETLCIHHYKIEHPKSTNQIRQSISRSPSRRQIAPAFAT